MSTLATDRTTIPVSIYHGTGSDFALVDADQPVSARRAFARRVCDRADDLDGVLFLALEPDFTPPRVVMTLVQPDGSTAPMCANGARCAAAWAMARTGIDAVMIDTQAGSRLAERVDRDSFAVEMGRPSFDPADIPASAAEPIVDRPVSERFLGSRGAKTVNRLEIDDARITAVKTGLPHTVVFVDDVDAVALDRLGSALGHADAFPRGTNVTAATPAHLPANDETTPAIFDQRTYECGTETDACATGAVAVAAAASRSDRFSPADGWELRTPGGTVRVRFDGRGWAVLIGPVVRKSVLDVSSTGSGGR